jgi:2Fe-2S ferredoxin
MTFQSTANDRDGTAYEVQWDTGQSLMECLRDNAGLPVTASCGGTASCATCHIHLSEETYQSTGGRNEDEEAMLEYSEEFVESGSRLACQIDYCVSLKGIEVNLAPEE